MFLFSTCYRVWLFIGFCVNDSDNSIASIRQRSYNKSLCNNMLHQTCNLMYFKYIMIISCIDLEPFFFAINLDVMFLVF